MKRIVALILAGLMLLSLCACGGAKKISEKEADAALQGTWGGDSAYIEVLKCRVVYVVLFDHGTYTFVTYDVTNDKPLFTEDGTYTIEAQNLKIDCTAIKTGSGVSPDGRSFTYTYDSGTFKLFTAGGEEYTKLD